MSNRVLFYGKILLRIIFVLCPTVLVFAQVTDKFYSRGREVPVRIETDKLAIVIQEGASEDDVAQFADQKGWDVTLGVSGRIYLVYLGASFDRQALVKLARTATEDPLITKAGLAVFEEESEVPMVLTDEFTVKFRPETTDRQINALNEMNRVRSLMRNPLRRGVFLLQVDADSDEDALTVSNRYHESDLTEYAHPNFTRMLVARSWTPDTFLGNQWHHHNSKQGGGVEDADIDTPQAWEMTKGSEGVVIAIIEGGFDTMHPDLNPNLWKNPGEVSGNNQDDDCNSLIDDIHGWDFAEWDVNWPGDNDVTVVNDESGYHGTSVAGAAAARGGNGIGVSGSCPNCRLMLLRTDLEASSDWKQVLAFDYAFTEGADIVSISWGYPNATTVPDDVVDAINNLALNGRDGWGIPVFIAMSTTTGYQNDCQEPTPDISSLPSAIAVSASNNMDRRTPSGYGLCMEFLAPADGGTLSAATSDVQGEEGYNCLQAVSSCPTPMDLSSLDYTRCFGGTSFSAPLTAGVAGLILSADSSLNRLQVQRLLQDTADRIEHSKAEYDERNGVSRTSPTSSFPDSSTHGYGRINAFEAVRVVAPTSDDGKNGVDVFFRDNKLDWGNTEQPSNTLFESPRGFLPHWQSMDIKVDAPPFGPGPTCSIKFDELIDEVPIEGVTNKVYVRVRNRGPHSAESVKVKLNWSYAGTSLPSLPSDFWTSFPQDSLDTSQWHTVPCHGSIPKSCEIEDLAYSGSSVAGTPMDNARIVQFDFMGPKVPQSGPNHFCLMAIVDSSQDPVADASTSSFIIDEITPNDNNVTQRNLKVMPAAQPSDVQLFLVRNPSRKHVRAKLTSTLPLGWEIVADGPPFDEFFDLDPGQEFLVKAKVSPSSPDASGQVTIVQKTWIGDKKIVGGITYAYGRPPKQRN